MTRGHASNGLITVVFSALLALGGTAHAQPQHPPGMTPDASTTRHHPPRTTQTNRADGGTASSDQNQGTTARGGGPGTTAPQDPGRHAASAHIITVQSNLDAMRAENEGLRRLSALSVNPMSSTYREHVEVFVQSLNRDLDTARHHAQELRASAQQLANGSRANDPLRQLDASLDEVRQTVSQVQREGGSVTADARRINTLSRQASDQIERARDSINRVERALRR